MSSNNTALPPKEDGESNDDYFARLQEHQAALNESHTQEAQALPIKICGECSYENNAASKTCGGVGSDGKRCGQRLNLSQTRAAVYKRKRRKLLAQRAKDASHNICNICKRPLSKSQDLGISLCFNSVVLSNGRNARRVEPCGRAMHLKCLQKQCNQSKKPHDEFGISPNKCAHCNRETKYPHYVQIHIPRD